MYYFFSDHPERDIGKLASKPESKIPRFDAGSKGNVTSSLEGDIALESNSQVVNKIPKSDSGKEASNHEATKDELKLRHGDITSKIPRLSSSSFSKRPAETVDVEVKRNEEAEQRGDEESEKHSFGDKNRSASDFESDVSFFFIVGNTLFRSMFSSALVIIIPLHTTHTKN